MFVRASVLTVKEPPVRKANAPAAEPRARQLKGAAQRAADSVDETPAYRDFPPECWTRLCTNSVPDG